MSARPHQCLDLLVKLAFGAKVSSRALCCRVCSNSDASKLHLRVQLQLTGILPIRATIAAPPHHLPKRPHSGVLHGRCQNFFFSLSR